MSFEKKRQTYYTVKRCHFLLTKMIGSIGYDSIALSYKNNSFFLM
ncbi:hypothetical protein D920_02072 [Enterococcus faecalis 13-SD-W-01]|nr:hypothetical protein D920_02072 [Enterococcus faecalis 13-SD-W-01]